MNLAVRLWSDFSEAQNPEAIPGVWPAEIRELGESIELPAPGTWQLMTQSEYTAYRAQHQSAYNAWRANKEFVDYKAKKLKDWDRETRNYIYSHYPAEKQSSIILLLMLATGQGATNRLNYLMGAVNWVMNEVLTHHYEIAYQYEAATSIAELDAVPGNFQQFDATDPVVGLAEALAIPD